jgi:RNA recognition motif 2
LREADVAFRGLDNQTMFGMKINVSGRSVNETKESDPPFPNASTAGKSFDGLSIGPAGSQSFMRMPFFQPGSPKSSTSSLTTPQIIPNQGSSPPYFYSSFRGLNTLVPYDHEVGPSGQHGAPGTHGTAEELQPLERRPSNVFQDGSSGYRPESIPPCYTPDGICLYCPSRGPSVAVPFNPGYHGLPSPTPIPTLYYPPHNLPQPIANVTPWALTPVPYLRDDYIAAGHQYYPSTPDQHIVQQPSHVLAHLPPVPTIPPKNSIYVSTRQSTPTSHESASSPPQFKTGTTMNNNATSGVSDRNQLNIARIEDGQDTRTTVMIKNIPNKMSHADLEAYIAKVCPRRIDFMYLRMDFQNGEVTQIVFNY